MEHNATMANLIIFKLSTTVAQSVFCIDVNVVVQLITPEGILYDRLYIPIQAFINFLNS